MEVTGRQFKDVFALPEIPTESEADLAADWLLNHNHKEPLQRVKAALKSLSGTATLQILLKHYSNQIRIDAMDLEFKSIDQLRRVKEYFMFPANYLNLSEPGVIKLNRTVNSILKGKITSIETLQDHHRDFIASLGSDMDELSELKYENDLRNEVLSFARVWNRSVLDKLDNSSISRNELSKIRINEIFDIVVNYPSSIPALHDLRQCMEPSQRALLVSSFIAGCVKRLLHAGANTNDIILCYTSTIKSFLILDPRGVLLDNASKPIRRYLKEREDTISSITHSLLNDDPEDELSRISDELCAETQRVIDTLTLDWFPDPIDASPDFKKQDIIESLISIFDSKDAFISELIVVFSKKLLSHKSYDISEITHKLNQLKVKFEENDLNNLDVMVRDIIESQETNTEIHSKNPNILEELEFVILSYLYWPELTADEFRLPSLIQDQIGLYREEFEKIKQGRTLKFVTSGLVTVELELGTTAITFEVSTARAAVIAMFHEVSSLTLNDICTTLEMDSSLAGDALDFWIDKSILFLNDKGEYNILSEEV